MSSCVASVYDVIPILSAVMCNGLMCFILAPTISPMLDIVLPRNETRVRSLAFELDYGIDMQTYWFWLWLHTSVAGVLVIFNSIAADITFITFTIHVCYLFAIVKHKLEHITDSITERTAQSFENCDHNNVYNIYRYKEQRSTLDKQAIYRECVVSHKKAIKLFVYVKCTKNNKFFRYSGAWYNIPVERQKDIVLILMRSRSPCQLTAGKLLVMSLENFCAV
ncbi:uncharacterized protein LOC116851300 [Odontomachus brunneus]|uniref:uncharacterized protein LOC116851300 n=1 Tax=Odontomachus brunneus TaxID=486640 RepID=UPI0013F18C40|nr:uncharacterized protein LOC116851300 [Odontomachus brunneus]